MMMIDEIYVLTKRYGVNVGNLVPFEQKQGSEANQLLARIESMLNLPAEGNRSLPQRLRRIQNLDLKVGDVVDYVGDFTAYRNKSAVVATRSIDKRGLTARIAGDRTDRYFSLANLVKDDTMTSITTRLKAALSSFITTAKPTNVKAAARELLAATLMCSAGDAAKKRAKKALIDLGISLEEFKPGTVQLFDDAEFTIAAVTKEPSSRLDMAVLTVELRNAGLSVAKITAAVNAAMVENKPATSIVVTEK